MLLLIDNYDSFTYNLVHCFQVLGVEVRVRRNNIKDELNDLQPDCLVVGPGPGNPSQSGLSKELIEISAGQIPVLGVCLGHQCIAEIYGGLVVKALKPMHGKTSAIYHDGKGIFSGLPQGFSATRYHSLIAERSSLPSCLEVSAETADGEIMGLRHRHFSNLEGVQFHPESIKTEQGMQLLANFLQKSHLLINQ